MEPEIINQPINQNLVQPNPSPVKEEFKKSVSMMFLAYSYAALYLFFTVKFLIEYSRGRSEVLPDLIKRIFPLEPLDKVFLITFLVAIIMIFTKRKAFHYAGSVILILLFALIVFIYSLFAGFGS